MKCKHERKNGVCGLKGCYAYRHKCYTEDCCKCFEPITNADRIRAMSDEELANYLLYLDSGLDLFCEIQDPKQDGTGCQKHDKCKGCVLDWLKQEAT